MSGGKTQTTRRWAIAAGLAIVAGGGAYALWKARQPESEFARLGRGIDDVALTSSNGEHLTWGQMRGAPRAVFFGFTHCPVICPVTIYELTAAADRLGTAAGDLRIEFITLDPERDTPERMQSYFSGFGPRVKGYTSTSADLPRVMRAFEVTARRVAAEGGDYTIDHTATVFLIDERGVVRDVAAYGAEPEILETRLRALTAA